MFKRILAVLLTALVAATALSACGPLPDEKTLPVQTNLNGTWAGSTDGAAFTAEVNMDHIKIDMKLRDTSGLYWVGSFKSLVNGPATIESAADTAVLKQSMFGSLDKSKSFSYNDDTIKFTMGIAGTTRDIELTKESN